MYGEEKLSKHRYRELKHFCLQYPEFKYVYYILDWACPSNGHDDPTSKIATLKTDYGRAIKLIETTARDTSEEYQSYILKSVTRDIPLNAVDLDRDVLDAYRRKFFWLLHQRKGI